jgi:hypothetical protein
MLYLLVLGPIIVGLIALAHGLRLRRLARASAQWPTVEAEILRAGIDERPAGRGGYVYRPEVVYRYRVNQRSFTADQLRPGEEPGFFEDGSHTWAEQVMAHYPRDRPLLVCYDPARPERAWPARGLREVCDVQARRALMVAKIGLGIGAILLLIAVF